MGVALEAVEHLFEVCFGVRDGGALPCQRQDFEGFGQVAIELRVDLLFKLYADSRVCGDPTHQALKVWSPILLLGAVAVARVLVVVKCPALNGMDKKALWVSRDGLCDPVSTAKVIPLGTAKVIPRGDGQGDPVCPNDWFSGSSS